MISLQPAGHLYIHIPFCRSRCSYCSFPSVAVETVPEKAYLAALEAEFQYRLKSWPQAFLPLATLYFGGGTPSLFSPSFYAKIIDMSAQRLGFVSEPEVTLEANPADISREKIIGYRVAGINRISLGVQTFAPDGLQLLGRRHDGLMVEKAVDLLRSEGIDNLSLDLIYAWPGQSRAVLNQDLRKLAALAPEHISAYTLSLEPETRLAQAVAAGKLQAVADDVQAEMMQLVEEGLKDAGLQRYEISSFARHHQVQARHNLAYWQLHEYLGLGAGACGGWRCRKDFECWDERYCNIPDPFAYMRRLEQLNSSPPAGGSSSELWPELWFEKEIIDRKTSFIESLMMGLRLRQGVGLAGLRDEYGSQTVDAIMPRAQKLRGDGLLDWDENNLWITEKGMFLSDTILSYLL
ncbi:MAG: radical SAM family heme chaperone HemW [Pseudomonadota bacterium]|nr:radical SAM family heme chaperone HemW [Pseudomonadota bacterium]